MLRRTMIDRLRISIVSRMLAACVGILAVASSLSCSKNDGPELLNVSYDPTRELWDELNAPFIDQYHQQTGKLLAIQMSHGGSTSQARAVVDGLTADVVTLALWSDTDLIQKAGLIADGWEKRLPHDSLPYYSTIVMVVRRGNPKGIHDWPDIVRPDVQVIVPNPKTSGNGKLAFLAAWGSVYLKAHSDEAAREYVASLYQHVPLLETGARAATVTFSQKQMGDVHLTWENEAHLEVRESRGALELVYPSISIRAEPYVAMVDANVDRHGTRAIAEEYLKFLYTPEAQEIIGHNFYRPIDEKIARKFAKDLPDIKLFTIDQIAKGWGEANTRFFAAGGVFDSFYEEKKP